eukprot:TRINITY_DN6223_c0_g2_i1.p1 TRINITY_DN6223_c0_g2~~TRINITY_DN6223_c0_g2_i1.p1  ORF type:complete len:243 (+),score=46.46 TRINITY_DN6223_c0_g2_i1:3-731(+)
MADTEAAGTTQPDFGGTNTSTTTPTTIASPTPAKRKNRPINVVLVGDLATGKTSLMTRYCEQRWAEGLPTLGIASGTRQVRWADETVVVNVRDTGGQERFVSLTTSHYRGASAFAVIYDIADSSSFRSVSRWLDNVASFADKAKEQVPVLLLGNKADLEDFRVVGESAARECYVTRHRLLFYEVSAKTGQSVDAAFNAVVNSVMLDRASNNDSDNLRDDIISLTADHAATSHPPSSPSECGC